MWGWEWEERRVERGEKCTPNRWKPQMNILAEFIGRELKQYFDRGKVKAKR